MTSPTHRRERAAAATASRSHNPPPPPPQPFPQTVPQSHNAMHALGDPFLQPPIQGPNPSPRDAVAAIRAQLAATPLPNVSRRRYNLPTRPANVAVPLGSAAIADLRAQAGVTVPVGSAAIAALRAQAPALV
jgi:hypothetical protein